ncbi:hypothetical protein BHE74_00038602 [Ensete ventricosum]|nr:hypothetical protein BHE74_00038602 [Ensete ventricosum]
MVALGDLSRRIQACQDASLFRTEQNRAAQSRAVDENNERAHRLPHGSQPHSRPPPKLDMAWAAVEEGRTYIAETLRVVGMAAEAASSILNKVQSSHMMMMLHRRGGKGTCAYEEEKGRGDDDDEVASPKCRRKRVPSMVRPIWLSPRFDKRRPRYVIDSSRTIAHRTLHCGCVHVCIGVSMHTYMRLEKHTWNIIITCNWKNSREQLGHRKRRRVLFGQEIKWTEESERSLASCSPDPIASPDLAKRRGRRAISCRVFVETRQINTRRERLQSAPNQVESVEQDSYIEAGDRLDPPRQPQNEVLRVILCFVQRNY